MPRYQTLRLGASGWTFIVRSLSLRSGPRPEWSGTGYAPLMSNRHQSFLLGSTLSRLLWTWTLCTLVGCTASSRYIGLVDASNPRAVQLVESSGRTYRLAVGDDAALFEGFGGCSVLVEGPRRLRTVLVRDWAVTDAGDGSAPFIGVLTREGVRWFVDDVQTGGRVYLDEASLGELRLHVGRTVLFAGYVSGPNTVNVVRWRLLGPQPPEKVGAMVP